MRSASVLIVGAGPTGLALACDLRSRGVDVCIIDKADKPAWTTRALGIQSRGRQILERLGAVPTEVVPQTKFDIFVDGHLALHVDGNALRGPDENGPLRAPQTAVERQLRQRLKALGAEVEWGHEITGAREDEGGVTVATRCENGETSVRAQWLVGCDGAHSAVRKLLGAEFEGSAFPQIFLLGDVTMSTDRTDGAVIYLRDNKVLTMASLPDGQWRIGVALEPDEPLAEIGRQAMTAERDKNAVSLQEGRERLQQSFTEYSRDRETRLLDPTWLSVFRINRRMASRFRAGRLLIAGDAAHLTSPLGGQGMNTGLSDAFNLGWKMALVSQGRAEETLLDTYEGERRPATEKIERATTQWTNVLMGNGRINRIVRGYVALPAMRFPFVQGWVLSRRPALHGGYRGGPLAPRKPVISRIRLSGFGPQPGDLAPDPFCRLQRGQKPIGVAQLIGANWGLVAFGGKDEEIGACVLAARSRLGNDLRVLRFASVADEYERVGEFIVEDYCGAVARAYRPGKKTTVLLRPDGFIAWRSRTCDVASLTSWLDDILRIKAAS